MSVASRGDESTHEGRKCDPTDALDEPRPQWRSPRPREKKSHVATRNMYLASPPTSTRRSGPPEGSSLRAVATRFSSTASRRSSRRGNLHQSQRWCPREWPLPGPQMRAPCTKASRAPCYRVAYVQSVSAQFSAERTPYRIFCNLKSRAGSDPRYQSTASIPGGLARRAFRSDLSASLRLTFNPFA